MPEAKIRCSHCKHGMQVTTSGGEEVVQVKCRNCGASHKFRTPANRSSATPSIAKPPSDDPLDFLSSPAPSPASAYSRSKPSPPANPYARTMTRTMTRTGPKSNLLLWLGIGAAVIVCLGVATVGVFWFVAGNSSIASAPDSPVNESSSSNFGVAANINQKPAVSFPKIPRPETRATLVRELDAMREKANRSVASISETEKQTIGADRLTEAEPLFREFFLRAAQAAPEELTMSDVAQNEAKLTAEVQQMSPRNGGQPPRNYIWTLNSRNDPADRWGTAAYSISTAKFRSEMALQSRVQYPDPLQENSKAFDWSSEERRVLSAYWLQGELERDVATELIGSLRENQSIKQIQDRCFAAIDRHFESAKALALVKSEQGSMLINEPKGTPYAKHARATRRVLQELMETFPEPNIEWIVKHTIRFSDAVEELQFGRTAAIGAFTQMPVRDQYDGIQAMIAKRKQEALAAEQAKEKQQQEDKAKQEETRRAALAAEQEKEQQLAQAKQDRESREQGERSTSDETHPNSDQGLAGGPGRAFGPGAGRPLMGIGRGQGGPGSNGPGGQPPASGPPPGFAGQGGGRPPNTPPTFPTPAMGTTVTIRITGPSNMDLNAYLEKLKAALKTGNYQMGHSGQEATITLGYAGDVQTVIDAIDFGTVESSDVQKREVRVKVK